jgi:signal transduction histidine kinase
MFETIIQHKDIRLEINISEDTLIYTDLDLVNCVIRNLLSNAIKYTPIEGKISIDCLENESYATLIVSDTGTGIPGEFAEKLFNTENYVSVTGLMQEKGSGLGLKLCKEFVELNGGTIWLKSEKSLGTQFFFTVPKTSMVVPDKDNLKVMSFS